MKYATNALTSILNFLLIGKTLFADKEPSENYSSVPSIGTKREGNKWIKSKMSEMTNVRSRP